MDLRSETSFDNGGSKKSRGNLSQIIRGRCCTYVDAQSEALIAMNANDGSADLEAVFKAQYQRIARVIAGVIRDHARAQELAVEVFLKWDRYPAAHGEKADGWLYRTAVRTALNELRRELRRRRYETLFAFLSTHVSKRAPSPEEIRAATEEQEQVQVVLNTVKRRDGELLLLRSSNLSYDEIAETLHLNPASIGTLLSRAEQLFRKEFIRRYGK
jgi:RNA polymerase sigma-70 factor (ECF subfamily)